MGKVIIVSKTKMSNDKVCVGGVDIDKKISVRLLDMNGFHEKVDVCPYNIWDVWDVSYRISNQRSKPHVEDVNVLSRAKIGTLRHEYRHVDMFLKILQQSDVPLFSGKLIDCFDGKLQCTQYGTLFINRNNIPDYSTCFWISDRSLNRSDFKGKIRYNYNDGERNWGYTISYVGLSDAISIIPKGSLIRLSLAHWWSPDNSDDEERCYLQLSGVLILKQVWVPTGRTEKLSKEIIDNLSSIVYRETRIGDEVIRHAIFFFKSGKPQSFKISPYNAELKNGAKIDPDSVVFVEYKNDQGDVSVATICEEKK